MALSYFLVACLGVFILGLSKGGFGGSLGAIGTPLLALSIDPSIAIAIMLPVLIFMDSIAMKRYWRQWNYAAIRTMLPAALIGIAAGFITFNWLNSDAIRLLVGVIAVIFVLGFRSIHLEKPSKRWGGFWGSISGFTSFVSHTGGPPMHVYLLSLRMDKTQYQATSVLLFTCINLSKIIPYSLLNLFSLDIFLQSLLLLPVALCGVFSGIWAHKRISQQHFFTFANILLAVTGCKLIFDGIVGLT